MPYTPEEIVERLYSISERDGVPYADIELLYREEQAYKDAIQQYKGYLALSDAFKCFFLESVHLSNTYTRPRIKTPLSEFYALFIPRLVHSFRSLCASEKVATSGYPHQGYTLLRNVFDDTVLTSAALQKVTDFYSIEGIAPGSKFDIDEVKKLRKATEFEVRRYMTGSSSGLSQATRDELQHWDSLFDFEVHGARLSLSSSKDWLAGISPLPVVPEFNEMQFALFMNRYLEIGWMVHRLIPLMQPPGLPFIEGWPEKWLVIDESFQSSTAALTEELGKKIGEAIVEFVIKKFPFNSASTFPL